MTVCFIGFTSSPISNWKSYVDKPSPPANYKKEEVIAEWMEQAIKKQEERAAKTAPLSSIHSYCLWSAGQDKPEEIAPGAASLMAWLSELQDQFGPVRLIGFDVERFVRTLYCEAGRNGSLPEKSALELGGLLGHALDPYRNLVPEWERNDVSRIALCQLMGVALTEANSADAKLLAVAARELAIRTRQI